VTQIVQGNPPLVTTEF